MEMVKEKAPGQRQLLTDKMKQVKKLPNEPKT